MSGSHSSSSSPKSNGWNCQICSSGASYPMMIVKCGHTFCESCIPRIEKCPVCRTAFDLNDCQPNFYVAKLAGDLERQEQVRQQVDLDTRLGDLAKRQRLAVISRVNRVVNQWLDSIEQQTVANPDTSAFTCQVTHPSLDLITLVKKRIEPYGFTVDVSEELARQIGKNPDSVEIRVIYRIPAPTTSGRGVSGTGTSATGTGGWITTSPLLNLLDLYSAPVYQSLAGQQAENNASN